MKKFNLRLPPPPPPEAPESSSSVSPGAQQYSPSRATSPNSDDDLPPPPTAASLPPRKVLGSDQAKRRLQAFAKMKLTTSPRKAAMQFRDEDHEQESSKYEGGRKRYPLVKEATPVMASIMKEETLSRDKVQRNMEKRNNRDDLDLRNLLNSRKKRDDEEVSIAKGRRSRSREKRRRRSSQDSLTFERNRKELKSRSSSSDRSRGRGDGQRNVDMFEESPEDKKRRKRLSGGSGGGRKRTVSGERRRSKSIDNLDVRSKQSTKKWKDSSFDGGAKRRSSGGSSMHSFQGLSPATGGSGKKKMSKEEKWNLPDLMVEMKKEKDARKDVDIWELKHGNKKENEEDEEENKAPKLFNVKKYTQNGQVLIKANEDKDYYEVKDENENRDTSSFIRNSEGLFIEFPSKFMKVTSEGMSFSYNVEVSKELYLEEKKSAKIRKSIDSMMFELENESKKKRESSGERAPSALKKKKKRLSDSKKGKKKKKLVEEDSSSPSPSGKKSKVKAKGKKGKEALSPKKKTPVKAEESKTSKVLGALGTSKVSLSAAGMSKLYSMAGYAAASEVEDKETKKTATKGNDIIGLNTNTYIINGNFNSVVFRRKDHKRQRYNSQQSCQGLC